MNVTPARLGIRPEYRHRTMYAAQYPINEIKRQYMIGYTKENEKNGFWHKVKYSLHCIPYTMVPKKKHGIITRFRPAFDGRAVNKYCKLMDSNMPTLKDFDDLHSIKGFTTMADVKNCFDCIPLHKDDQKYAVAMTPLGLYQMTCLTYGWMNAAPNAQRIMNQLSVYVTYTLAYIDDICIKHPFHWGTEKIVKHIQRLFDFCRQKNIKLNPTKFFPCSDRSESFAFERTLVGKHMGEAYKNKVLLLARPYNGKDKQAFRGTLGYVAPNIPNCQQLLYWITKLDEDQNNKGKLQWSPQAELAYRQLMFLVANSPILHNPTREGTFCVKTDASNYGVGAILYQLQWDESLGKDKWVIIDMWSRILPQPLRRCEHSNVFEAYAIVGACINWRFFLIKRKFIISTDNEPVASIFDDKDKKLDIGTRKTLARLCAKINGFCFDCYHVKGLDNTLADSLSRFTAELYTNDNIRALEPITSKDTNHLPLTDEDKKYLDEYLHASVKLRTKQRLYSKQPLITIIDELQQEYNESKDKDWCNLLQQYRLNASYLERDRIKDLFNSADDNNSGRSGSSQPQRRN